MTWPTVTEQPLRLEPTSKDTFLDGLSGGLGWPEPPSTRDQALWLSHHPARPSGGRRHGGLCAIGAAANQKAAAAAPNLAAGRTG